jgi:hypothetical protein
MRSGTPQPRRKARLRHPVPALASGAVDAHVCGMMRARTSIGSILLLWGLALAPAGHAQESIDQFNAANAENRRHTAAQSALGNEALRLQQDQEQGVLGCRSLGSGSAAGACQGNVRRQIGQRSLQLDSRSRQEQDLHRSTLRAIGVSPAQ